MIAKADTRRHERAASELLPPFPIATACHRSYTPRVLDKLSRQLAAANALTDEEVRLAVELLVDEAILAPAKADFLACLARKGETAGEITAFARELHNRALQPVLDGESRAGIILDVVGTGGDRLSTFNISTTVALLAAAAGVRVAPTLAA